jgi:organic radical activating enzyme
MALQNESDLSCCNVNKASWKNNKHEVMHVYSHPLKDAFKSYTRKMIASSLDNGVKHPSCQACWDLEEAGSQSSRQQFNAVFKNLEPLEDQPRVLIIKPGNTCNYACRMCNPLTSSSWYADGYKLENPGITFNEYTKTFETIRNSFNPDHVEFWDQLKQWIANIECIHIYGGEPFLIPAMFDLLEHGISIGANKNIALAIHTNASIWNQRYLEILSAYKSVDFSISIDSMVPAQLSYIRHKADYDVVIKNTLRFKEFFKDFHNVKRAITLTITPLNVFYLNQISKDLKKITGLNFGENIVTTPEYDIRHLPIPVKQFLMSTINSPKVVNFLKQTIPGCDIEWPKFCRVTDQLDQIRNQSFAETFPEWWKMLEPYWVK